MRDGIAKAAAAQAEQLQSESPEGKAQEIELKLEGGLAAVKAAFNAIKTSDAEAEPRARNLASTYYDTADGALRAKRHVLRVRKSYRRYIATLKWQADESNALVRGEREARLASSDLDIACLGPDIAAAVLGVTKGAPLVEQFTTQIKRRVRTVNTGHTQIEAAFDTGAVVAADRREPVCELELELKGGDEVGLYEFAAELCVAHGLRLGVLTKAERGFMLAAREELQERRSRAPDISDEASVDTLVGAVIGECLDQFTANWPVLHCAGKAEAIHQMRVGLRRLRVALALFNRAMPCEQFLIFRAEAKQLAAAMGPARDIDAFITLAQKGPLSFYGRDESFDKLLTAAAKHREASYARVRAVITDQQTTRFVLELRAFLARRGWRNSVEAADLPKLNQPAAGFAKLALKQLDKRTLKRGKKLAELLPAERHELRIALKNLRYAAEFFGSLFSSAAVKKYNRAAAELQEALGSYNDAIVAKDIVGLLEEQAGPASARAAGVMIGWCARGSIDAGHDLLGAWKTFRRADRFW